MLEKTDLDNCKEDTMIKYIALLRGVLEWANMSLYGSI